MEDKIHCTSIFQELYELYEIEGDNKRLMKRSNNAQEICMIMGLLKNKQFKMNLTYTSTFEGTGEEILKKIQSNAKKD